MARKSSLAGWIIGLVVVVIVVAGAIWAKGYYNDRYVSQSYYAQVPADEKMEIEGMKDNQGKVFDKGHTYELTAYDKDGKARKLEVTVYTDKVSKLYKPGTYLKIEASKQIVTGQSVIREMDIPPAAFAKIQD
ncbi:MAG: YxeA family protein [Bifidobacteriaceae bacterium]|jgi:uncharacterized protein YxeA|nr:YxeA family protein [Bifidobacteriaceae bacterium]MCI1914812.1 YxeA family protein [Bifidobacteriaceae bacterium]